jgi:hypothetical protein
VHAVAPATAEAIANVVVRIVDQIDEEIDEENVGTRRNRSSGDGTLREERRGLKEHLNK